MQALEDLGRFPLATAVSQIRAVRRLFAHPFPSKHNSSCGFPSCVPTVAIPYSQQFRGSAIVACKYSGIHADRDRQLNERSRTKEESPRGQHICRCGVPRGAYFLRSRLFGRSATGRYPWRVCLRFPEAGLGAPLVGMEFPPEPLPTSISLRETRARTRLDPQVASLLMFQTNMFPGINASGSWILASRIRVETQVNQVILQARAGHVRMVGNRQVLYPLVLQLAEFRPRRVVANYHLAPR